MKKNFLIIIIFACLGTILRFYLNNNFLVTSIGSFIYGFVISRELIKSKREILLTGFCSCFTSFSGVVYFLYQLTIQGHYVMLFFYLNLIVIFNLLIMYVGFLLSRKMTEIFI